MLAEDRHSSIATALVAGAHVVHLAPGTGEFGVHT